jgi:hypothetical protein
VFYVGVCTVCSKLVDKTEAIYLIALIQFVRATLRQFKFEDLVRNRQISFAFLIEQFLLASLKRNTIIQTVLKIFHYRVLRNLYLNIFEAICSEYLHRLITQNWYEIVMCIHYVYTEAD